MGGSALLPRPAEAAIAFNNYNGFDCSCGYDLTGFSANAFTTSGNYDFTGAAAFVENLDTTTQEFSLALYSSTSTGAPGSSPLWTSETLTAPGPFGTPTLVTASYPGSPILLRSGEEYFLALDLPGPSGLVQWLAEGPNDFALYISANGMSWIPFGVSDQQFQVFGSPATVIPEPSTWAMMLIGFAGPGFAGYRASRKAAAVGIRA
jgi:PEP-CTERM motif